MTEDPQSWRELRERMTPVMWLRATALVLIVLTMVAMVVVIVVTRSS